VRDDRETTRLVAGIDEADQGSFQL
jgi:hypothetical protein